MGVKWEINEGKVVRFHKIAPQGACRRGHSPLPSPVPPPYPGLERSRVAQVGAFINQGIWRWLPRYPQHRGDSLPRCSAISYAGLGQVLLL
jgi:hypothetical protein